MELAQCRMVTGDVEGLAGFYARLLTVPATLNGYYDGRAGHGCYGEFVMRAAMTTTPESVPAR
jgi:hypothetical protein